MAPQRAQTQRASAKKQHGDATGKKERELQAEHAEEQKEAAQRMAMSSAVKQDAATNEITDITTGEVLRDEDAPPEPDFGDWLTEGEAPLGADEIVDLSGEQAAVQYDELSPEELAVFEGPATITPRDQARMENEAPRAPGPGVVDLGEAPEIVKDDNVIIRVNTTLEDVTIGYGNTYSFEEGRRYKVPRNIADHLNEKGLVDRWG